MFESRSKMTTTTEPAATMDDDSEESDDDYFDYSHEFFDTTPFPDDCTSEADGIESFRICFARRYNACPAFSIGSLQDACEQAFSPTVVKERRPVLVYIHHDKSVLSNIFCSNTFCSEIVIDFLLENYLVWPWDVTHESNRNILMILWQNIFCTELFNAYSIEQYPMLIGIMRRSQEEEGWLSTSEYQCKVLLEGFKLPGTHEQPSRELLINQLVSFKEKFDHNEQCLSFDFIAKIGLCWDVIFEISKYLSLNETIDAFSTQILPLLRGSYAKVHISEIRESFINMILHEIKREQIVSLRLNANQFWPKMDLALLTIFTEVISLTLLNLDRIDQIGEYEAPFSKLTCLILRYDSEVDFIMLSKILNQLRRPIKRFEICCAGSSCLHFSYIPHLMSVGHMENNTVEYFLLDIRHFPLASMNNCFQHHTSCFLMTTTDLIKKMPNIRHVHLILNKYNVEKMLYEDEWKSLAEVCQRLKKVKLEVIGKVVQGQQLTQKALKIQKALHSLRQTIRFQIISI